jgi:hypothetical protein
MARTVSKTESFVGYGVLLVLLLITGGILLKQSRFHPSVVTPGELQVKTRAQLNAPGIPGQNPAQYAPQTLVALSPPEFFGPENLSDKINGKAELYLSAGFVGLTSQRFAIEDSPDAWMEAFIYHMDSARGSFAVYSLQRRFEAEKLNIGDFAYRTENALYCAYGPYYLEMVSSTAQEMMANLMLAFAENFIDGTTVSGDEIGELALFPTQNLKRETIALLPSDGFGFQRFDSMFTAQYEINDTELTAFLSERKNSVEAADLVQAYVRFLLTLGGTEHKSSLDIPELRVVEIMDTSELIFNKGRIVAGVHAGENRRAAEELAHRLHQKLTVIGQ